jgi:hypothetical protein
MKVTQDRYKTMIKGRDGEVPSNIYTSKCATRARTCNLINLLIVRLRTSKKEPVAKNLNLRNNSQQIHA